MYLDRHTGVIGATNLDSRSGSCEAPGGNAWRYAGPLQPSDSELPLQRGAPLFASCRPRVRFVELLIHALALSLTPFQARVLDNCQPHPHFCCRCDSAYRISYLSQRLVAIELFAALIYGISAPSKTSKIDLQ